MAIRLLFNRQSNVHVHLRVGRGGEEISSRSLREYLLQQSHVFLPVNEVHLTVVHQIGSRSLRCAIKQV